jgi:CubicO group peptidase (beta-lactamase class C family)
MRFPSRCVLAVAMLAIAAASGAQVPRNVDAAMSGFDTYMTKVLRDWDAPGLGIGIVVRDSLVWAKGYGYRDYGRKIPYTPTTTQPIASNSKLFTVMAAGMLVADGKLGWDEPFRRYVPDVRFYNDELDREITLRDMLSHRTGVTRHDLIWYESPFTRKELWDRMRYLEPSAPVRTTFLYNNLMYTAVGYAIEELSGKTWEQFVQQRILDPLQMTHTTLTLEDNLKRAEHAVPYSERRDSTVLYQQPYYTAERAIAPAGAINSSVQDLSHWLIALMNDGRYHGAQVIPSSAIRESLRPSIALPNSGLESFGWTELLNSAYGMGRWTVSYRGHLLAYHGGDLPGFHSQVSTMPNDSIGIIVLVVGDHAQPLYNALTYEIYERLLGMSNTPWTNRQNAIRLRNKAAATQARATASAGRVPNTRPSHPIEDYLGEYEHPAYGVLAISKGDTGLVFDLHGIKLPLSHFHYDRFDTPDDEQYGKWSVNFLTNPMGEVDGAEMSLDESAVTFKRRVPAVLAAEATLRQYAGSYKAPSGATVKVVYRPGVGLVLPGSPDVALQPWRPHQFRLAKFPDVVVSFDVKDGQVSAMRQRDPGGEYVFPRARE